MAARVAAGSAAISTRSAVKEIPSTKSLLGARILCPFRSLAQAAHTAYGVALQTIEHRHTVLRDSQFNLGCTDAGKLRPEQRNRAGHERRRRASTARRLQLTVSPTARNVPARRAQPLLPVEHPRFDSYSGWP